jgi:hypothetical protein
MLAFSEVAAYTPVANPQLRFLPFRYPVSTCLPSYLL